MSSNQATKSAIVKKADRSARNSESFIGELVWWSMNNVNPTRDQLRSALIQAGFKTKEVDDIFLPPILDKKQAFTRAIAACVALLKTQEDTTNGKTYILKRVHDTVDEIVYALLHAQHTARQSKEDTDTKQLQVFKFKKADSSWSHSSDLYLAEFSEAFEYAMEHYRDDHVRKIILDVLSMWESIAVRESGGVYFVPREVTDDPAKGTMISTSKILDALEKFLTSPYLGSCTFTRLAIADTPQSRESMSQTYENNILGSVSSLREEVELLIGDGKHPVSARALESKSSHLLRLREQASVYATILGAEFKKLNDATKSLEDAIRKSLGVAG